LSVCLFVFLSICLFANFLFVCLSFCLIVSLSFCLIVCLPALCLSVYLFVCLLVYFYASLIVFLPVCFSLSLNPRFISQRDSVLPNDCPVVRPSHSRSDKSQNLGNNRNRVSVGSQL
jgi:uncharacterized membrane protein YedE/YeeE